jgi:lysophospholipase L1-like esterase
MNVSFDQLRSFATGCAEIRQEPEGLFFDRMPPSQRLHYGNSEGAITRARCQAGVRLRFRSNSRRLSVTIRFNRFARKFDCLDLVVDGIFLGTFQGDREKQPCRIELFCAPEALPRSFELWLPYSVESWVVALELEDGASAEPLPPEPVNWLVIGDSISQGMTCSSPSRTYPALAARSLGWNHHNVAVGGARMAGPAGDVRTIPATVATVAFGCNDWNGGKTVEAFETDTRTLLDALFHGHPGLPTGLLTPFPAVWATGEKNKDGVWLESFREVLRKIAPAYPSVRLLEGPALIPADEGAFLDGIHPNNAGMAVLARNLAPELGKIGFGVQGSGFR